VYPALTVSDDGLFKRFPTAAEYHRWRVAADARENQRMDRLSAFVENHHVSGVYEVIDVVEE
jgi:hypothetical protein